MPAALDGQDLGDTLVCIRRVDDAIFEEEIGRLGSLCRYGQGAEGEEKEQGVKQRKDFLEPVTRIHSINTSINIQ